MTWLRLVGRRDLPGAGKAAGRRAIPAAQQSGPAPQQGSGAADRRIVVAGRGRGSEWLHGTMSKHHERTFFAILRTWLTFLPAGCEGSLTGTRHLGDFYIPYPLSLIP